MGGGELSDSSITTSEFSENKKNSKIDDTSILSIVVCFSLSKKYKYILPVATVPQLKSCQ